MPDAAAPFTGRLGFGERPALLVIDMVRAYVDERFPLYIGDHAHDLVASIRCVVDAARTAHVPIIFTGVRYEPGGADGGIFFRKVPPLALWVGDTEAGELVAELKPEPGEPVVLKQYPSALFGTSIASMLVGQRVDTVILCGVSTGGCVRATATDVMQHGFVPIVVRQAVGDRHPGPHEANLFDIDAKIGDVVDLDDVLTYFARMST